MSENKGVDSRASKGPGSASRTEMSSKEEAPGLVVLSAISTAQIMPPLTVRLPHALATIASAPTSDEVSSQRFLPPIVFHKHLDGDIEANDAAKDPFQKSNSGTPKVSPGLQSKRSSMSMIGSQNGSRAAEVATDSEASKVQSIVSRRPSFTISCSFYRILYTSHVDASALE